MKQEQKYQIYGIQRSKYDATYYGVTSEDKIDEQCGGIIWAASPESALKDFICEISGEDPYIRAECHYGAKYAVCEYFAYFAELIEDEEAEDA